MEQSLPPAPERKIFIAQTLSEHRAKPMRLHEHGYFYECSCGHTEIPGTEIGLSAPFNIEWEHAHQAEVLDRLMGSGASQAELSEAWEEGASAPRDIYGDVTVDNPYKDES